MTTTAKTTKLLGPLTLRPSADGKWWALNRRDKGWSSFGYPFAFLGDALEAFGARLVDFGQDEHGLWLEAVDAVKPAPAPPPPSWTWVVTPDRPGGP